MPILANLFKPLPTTAPPSTATPSSIPIPKYPLPVKHQQNHRQPSSNPLSHTSLSPAFKTNHRNSKYYEPIKPGQNIPLPDGEDRAIIVGNSGISYQLPGSPFEFMYSYSETPKAQPLAMREPAFLPFAPPTMPRPWTGKAPMKKSKRNIKIFESLGCSGNDERGNVGGKRYEMLRDYELGKVSVIPREEVLGEPLARREIKDMLKPYISSNKQINLGRDGLTNSQYVGVDPHALEETTCL